MPQFDSEPAAAPGASAPPPCTLAALKLQSRWLTQFAANVTSQFGENGIIAKALSLLPGRNGWCVEFGAGNGVRDSNTFDLVDREDYDVVLIEGHPARFAKLAAGYPHKNRAHLIQSYVGWSGESRLDSLLLGQTRMPINPDLISIDVDGNDFHIWSAVVDLRPKLVLIEFNPTMSNSVDFVQPADLKCQQGSSPSSLVKLGKEKGYELIAATEINLLFTDQRYYTLFSIPDNSLELMRDDVPNHISFAYDGTVILSGDCSLPWHASLRLTPRKVQLLPRMLREGFDDYSIFQKLIFASILLWNRNENGWVMIRNAIRKSTGRADRERSISS
jgi:hypothetical protein